MQIIKKYTLLYIFYTLNYHTSSTKTDRILSHWFMCLEKHKPICIIITGAFLTYIALILFRKWYAHRKEQFNLKAYFIKENYYENYVLNKIFYIDTNFKKVTIEDQNTTSLENENNKQCYFAIISDNMNNNDNNDNLIIEIHKPEDSGMLYIWPHGGETDTDNIVIKKILSCINTYIKDTIKAKQKEIKIELQEEHSHSNVTFLKPYHTEYDIFNPQDTPAFFSNVMQALNMENNNQENNLANFIFAIFTFITDYIQENHNAGKCLNSDSLLETTIFEQLSHNKELIQPIQKKNDIPMTTISAAIIENQPWKKIIFESSRYFLYIPNNMHALLYEKKIPEGYLGALCFNKITSTLSKKSNSLKDKYETSIIQDSETKENVGFITYQLQDGIKTNGCDYQKLRKEDYQEKKTLFIYCFGIKPTSQNKGYGQKALQAIENLHKNNISYIYLMSGNSDFQKTSAERQSKFYKKCGFTEYKTQQKKRSSQTSMFFSLYIKEVKKSEPKTKIRES